MNKQNVINKTDKQNFLGQCAYSFSKTAGHEGDFVERTINYKYEKIVEEKNSIIKEDRFHAYFISPILSTIGAFVHYNMESLSETLSQTHNFVQYSGQSMVALGMAAAAFTLKKAYDDITGKNKQKAETTLRKRIIRERANKQHTGYVEEQAQNAFLSITAPEQKPEKPKDPVSAFRKFC